MTRKQVEAVLRGWQRRLGLERWDLRIDWDKPANEDADASTWRSNDYDRAILYLDPGWQKWEREFLNRIVVHELLHLMIRDIDTVIDSLETHLHRDVFSVMEHRYKHEYEGFVDRMSYRLVEFGGAF